MRNLMIPAILLVTGFLLAAPPKVVEEISGKVVRLSALLTFSAGGRAE